MSNAATLDLNAPHFEQRDGQWHAVIPGQDGKPESRSFATLNRAKAWASKTAAARKRYAGTGEVVPSVYTTTLGDVLMRYKREVSPQKKGAKPEGYRIDRIAADHIGALLLNDLTSKAVADYKTSLIMDGLSASSVRNYMTLIRQSIEYARREWGFEIPTNPAALVTLPRNPPGRERRLEPGEFGRLEDALGRHPVVWSMVQFAIHTGMRRGEILRMKWRHVSMGQGTAYLPTTKNGSSRTVPLPDAALKVLKDMKPYGEDVFPVNDSALRWAFNRARTGAMADLRFHDLRHEAVSRLFEMGLAPTEVALISGHKTISMLMRYLHLRPVELARKLRGKTWTPETAGRA